MTIQQAIEKRKRDSKGKFVQTIAGGWRTKSSEYQKEYLRNNPWARHYGFSKGRSKKLGIEHTMSVSDFRLLWMRDKAIDLKSPSIDRIDPKKGYVIENCRFIERSENSARAQRGRKTTEKQRETARKNISGWAKSRKKKHMTIQETITKAIEGGWNAGKEVKIQTYYKRLPTVSVGDLGEDGEFLRTQEYLLDPLFWQSLGKAMGWETQFDEDKGFNHQWQYEWHRFIDHLAEGKDAESFFESL